ncbi:MAG TPA: hypothetical protein VIT85_05030 [Solirubrobacterales bacterium]
MENNGFRVLALTFMMLAALVGTAHGADRIYWTSLGDGKVYWANLDGSGGMQELNASGTSLAADDSSNGGAIDPVQQRFYWANYEESKIHWAKLDGSGGGDLATGSATVVAPGGVSVDPVARRVYWANVNDVISYANLDGSGGGDLSTPGASSDGVTATTVFPAAGRIYWTNYGFISGWLSSARTDGSGGEQISIVGVTPDTPYGIAIDAAAGKLYWADVNPERISVANLDGSQAVAIDKRGLEMKAPYGIALDPEEGKVYAANVAGDNLTFLRTDGSGGATVPVALPKNNAPNMPVVYKEPRATSAPKLDARAPLTPKFKKKGRRKAPSPLPKLIGSSLTCAGGSFAPDLVEARLYRAPVTISRVVTRDGEQISTVTSTVKPEGGPQPVPMAISPPIASKPGNYRCQETATNAAGSTVQTTAPVAIFKTGKLKLNKAKGTAKLTVELPAEKGSLKLAAKGFEGVSKEASGKAIVLVKPKGARKAKLADKGKLKAVVKLTYTPPDGAAATLRKRLTLRQP